MDGDMSFLEHSQLEKTTFFPMANTRLIHRPIENGTLLLLFNQSNERRDYIISDRIQMGVEQYGMLLERNGFIFLAEFTGTLAIGGRELAYSENRLVLRSLNDMPLSETAEFEVLPFAPGKLKLKSNMGWKCSVYDSNKLLESTLLVGETINITEDLVPYTLRFKKIK